MKKKTAPRKPLFNRYLIQVIVLSSVAFLMILVGSYKPTTAQSPSQVLGVKTQLADKNENFVSSDKSGVEENKKVEVTDTPEPKETPEPTDIPEREKEVKKVENEINHSVKDQKTEQVEVQPVQEGSDSGKVLLQNRGKTTLELNSPVSSTTAVMNLTTASAGNVSVHVNSNGILINNGPYQILTQFPVVINPADQTLAIKTPSGVTIIKTFPSQALENLPSGNKFTSVSSISLTQQQGEPIYQVNGVQARSLLGFIPVTANVTQEINAQTGQVVSSQLPWYYSLFGFAFKSI